MDAPRIDGFEILKPMPRGAMGIVYKARQISLDRIVALKVLPSELAADSADVDQFLTEARITANLRHPNIVQVYDVGKSAGDVYFFVMEFISGYSVGEWIRRKRVLTEENSLLVCESVAEALEYAWKKDGVIHCDIKPDNIMIDGDGTVKVADLGLAKSIHSIVDGSKTDSGIVCGTPNYISPEQSRGDASLDLRADIYSLGATLYHCVTGKMPFEGEPLVKVMDLQISEQIPDPQDLNQRVSAEAAGLMEKMMAKDRKERHHDWKSVLEDIARVMDRRMPAGRLPEPGGSTIRRSARRGKHLQPKAPTDPLPGSERAGSYADSAAFADMERKFERKQKRRAPPVPVWLAAAAIGILLLIPALRAFRSHLSAPFDPPETTAEPGLPLVDEPPDESELPAPVPERERIAGKKFLNALNWAARHPEDYDGGIRVFEQVAGETLGTDFEQMALAEIEAIKEARRAAMASLMQKLEKEANALGLENRYAAAAGLFESYDGALASDTAEARRMRARAWREKQRDLEESEARKRAAEDHWRNIIRTVASALVDGEPDAALEHASGVPRETLPAGLASELDGLREVLAVAAHIDERILDSFRAQVDREVTLMLVTGPEKLTIREVRDDSVEAERIVVVRAGHVSHPRTIRTCDLAPREKLLRLGPGTGPRAALLSGLVFARAGDLVSAEPHFAASEPVLADALVAEIKRRRGLQTEESAGRALASLMRLAQVDVASEIPTVSECLAALRRRPISGEEGGMLAEAVSAYRKKFGETAFAERYEPVLRLLERAAAGGPARLPPGESAPPDPGTVERVSSILLDSNPGLGRGNIRFETDDSGRVIGATLISSALQDIRPLALLTGLRKVNCIAPRDPAGLSDISPLKGLLLRELNLSNTGVSDISALSGMPLEKLGLSSTGVRDIQVLAGMPLTELDISRTRVRDIRALQGLMLTRLDVNGTHVDTIAPLHGMPLSDLNIGGTRVRHITPLRGMRLRSLNIGDTGIGDIGVLRGMPLEHLRIGGTQVRDLGPLSGMPLQYLDINGLNVKDLSLLKDMPLRHLNAGNTKVSDLGPLSGMPLRSLDLENTEVGDLSALKTMRLERLNIASTKVNNLGDLSGLNLNWLSVRRTNVGDLGPLSGMPLRFLDLSGTQVRDLRPIQGLPIEHIRLDDSHVRSFMAVLHRMPDLRTVNGRRFIGY